MKKAIFLFFMSLALLGCSSDEDDGNPNISIHVRITSLEKIEGVDYGFYYIHVDPQVPIQKVSIPLYFPSDSNIEEFDRACNAKCPNRNVPHSDNVSIHMDATKGVYVCTQCKVSYSADKGIPLNTDKYIHKLQIYNVKYDKETKIYRVWS